MMRSNEKAQDVDDAVHQNRDEDHRNHWGPVFFVDLLPRASQGNLDGSITAKTDRVTWPGHHFGSSPGQKGGNFRTILASSNRMTEHASDLNAVALDRASNTPNWASASDLEYPSNTIPSPQTVTLYRIAVDVASLLTDLLAQLHRATGR
jgi:hypothetical protein